jgi:hypothetical protein
VLSVFRIGAVYSVNSVCQIPGHSSSDINQSSIPGTSERLNGSGGLEKCGEHNRTAAKYTQPRDPVSCLSWADMIMHRCEMSCQQKQQFEFLAYVFPQQNLIERFTNKSPISGKIPIGDKPRDMRDFATIKLCLQNGIANPRKQHDTIWEQREAKRDKYHPARNAW